jgi:hypothetical protein
MKRLFLVGLFIFAFVFSFGLNSSIVLAGGPAESGDAMPGEFADEDVVGEEFAGEEAVGDEPVGESWTYEDYKVESVKGPLSCNLGVNVSYDSNVFIYSDTAIDEYDAGTNTARFNGVDSIDDVITNLFFIARLKGNILDCGATILSAGVEGNIYAENTDRTYMITQTSLKQRLNDDNILKVGYKYLPEYFIRTLYDPDFPVGDRYQKADFESHTTYVKYWHRIMDGWTWWSRYSYESKDYNSNFKERDTDSHRISLAMGIKPGSLVKVTPFFRYFWHDAEGADLDADVDSDISRDGFDIGVNTCFFPQSKFSYLVGYAFRDSEYSTDNTVSDDPYHSGREQERHRVKGRVNYKLKDNVDLFTEYIYETRDVSTKGTDADLLHEALMDYTKHIGKIGLALEF